MVAPARQLLRGLMRSPGFAAAVLLTLATGIGASTAVFSVVDGALLGSGDQVVRQTTIVLRTPLAGTPALARQIEQAVWSVSPSLAVTSMRTMQDVSRLMESLLLGVAALDAVTYVLVAALLTAVAALASYLSALRAAAVDPAEALAAD